MRLVRRRGLAALGLVSLLGCGSGERSGGGTPEFTCLEIEGAGQVQFHGEERRGLSALEVASVDAVRQGPTAVWTSSALHPARLFDLEFAPLIYATPLLVDGLLVTATSNGWLYAINAGPEERCGASESEIVWETPLVNPEALLRLDGVVPMGILSTPVVDLDADPPTLYAAGHDVDKGWQLFALDARSGTLVDGWPVPIDDTSVGAVNTNGPARFFDSEVMSQRGALTLSPDGDRVYVAFGTYWGEGAGWIVGIDTELPRVATAFSAAPSTESISSGGIWGSAGVTVDNTGDVWLTTGNAPPGSADAPGVWGSSLLQLDANLNLERAYTPFNYCALDDANLDLGASQPLLLPPLAQSPTPDLIAFGGKQGTVYLVDRDAIATPGPARPPCSADPSTDRSLPARDDQPHYDGERGPLSVFGPYSDVFGQIDHAKMRTKLAAWTDARGRQVLFASGSSKETAESTVSVAPSIAKIVVDAPDDRPAGLTLEAVNPNVVMQNPGSPIVTETADGGAVVWVLDRNALRSAPLLDPATPGPVLYAFDGETLELLWRSDPGALAASGKYSSPLAVGTRIYVGTDRIQGFEFGP